MCTSVSGVSRSHGHRQDTGISAAVLQIVPQPSRTPVPSKCIEEDGMLVEDWVSKDVSRRRSDLGDASDSKHLQPKHQQPFCFFLQAYAALVPGVSQVDNGSDFLGKKPHRKHPGILHLPHVQLPQALADAAQLLLFGEKLREGEAR